MRVYLNLSKIYDKEDTAQLAQLRRIKSLIRGVTEFSTVRLQDESDIRFHEWLKRSALPMSFNVRFSLLEDALDYTPLWMSDIVLCVEMTLKLQSFALYHWKQTLFFAH